MAPINELQPVQRKKGLNLLDDEDDEDAFGYHENEDPQPANGAGTTGGTAEKQIPVLTGGTGRTPYHVVAYESVG